MVTANLESPGAMVLWLAPFALANRLLWAAAGIANVYVLSNSLRG